ncbi:hypothetical protein IWQ60_001712 [Tieghemiomyces parasiticus]|uniref:Protein RER1 n=1 Tax=Tieghemiomyces parasiticus TaxID=78921 RepID=A0A9W8AK71_9FUNG|nr:hypothetical protein IWQ60_001712 [Tieghemiomyces parasiticus]
MVLPTSPTTATGINSDSSVATNVNNMRLQLERRAQRFLDSTISYTAYRWVFTALSLVAFLTRILMTHGWYIVTYALGIYLLNLFLAFLTPKWVSGTSDSVLDNDGEDEMGGGSSSGGGAGGLLDGNGPGLLPTSNSEEFRPFIRRLPEFKFWLSATQATLVAFACTLFPFLDIPVYWPILLVYFVLLFVLTMRRQIEHMMRHKYLPFDLGKKSYRRV